MDCRSERLRGTVSHAAVCACAPPPLFESGGMPWKEHLYALEREHGLPEACVKFVLSKTR